MLARHLAFSLLLSLAACDDVVSEITEQGLEELVDEQIEDHDFVSAAVSVRLDNGDIVHAAAGRVAPLGGDAYDVHRTEQVIGSVTKLYTAVLVMQLVEAERIGLDDTIDRWFDFPSAEQISIRMLLNHTSGLNDYLHFMTFEEVGLAWTPAQLLAKALAEGPIAAPGVEKAIYSNTNFLLLALVVEAETGLSWEENLETRIAAPLGLHHTYFAGERDKAADLAAGWLLTDDGWIDSLSFIDPSVGWAVGGVVATNAELMRFTAAFFDGELFESPATLALMRRYDVEMDRAYQDPAEPPTRVGLATMSLVDDGITLEGHFGHIEGYNAAAHYDPDRDEVIVVTSNDDSAYAAPIAFDVARFLRDR